MHSSDPTQAGLTRTTAKIASPAPSLVEIIDQVVHAAAAKRVSVREILCAIGGAGFAAILLMPALAVTTPLSGIPMLSTVMGTIIFLVALQMLTGRENLWLPRWILNQQVNGDLVARAFNYVRRPAAWLDDRTNKRLVLFARKPLVSLPQLVCLCSGAVMPLLEFVPFSSSIVGFSVALFALGMLARDGMIILLGFLPLGFTLALLSTAFSQS